MLEPFSKLVPVGSSAHLWFCGPCSVSKQIQKYCVGLFLHKLDAVCSGPMNRMPYKVYEQILMFNPVLMRERNLVPNRNARSNTCSLLRIRSRTPVTCTYITFFYTYRPSLSVFHAHRILPFGGGCAHEITPEDPLILAA